MLFIVAEGGVTDGSTEEKTVKGTQRQETF